MAAADDDDDDGCHMKKNMMNVATRESWKVDSCPPQKNITIASTADMTSNNGHARKTLHVTHRPVLID